jgi:glycosyltransferase involved in cell wall biosynthesis
VTVPGELASTTLPFGVNIIGFVDDSSSLSEVARLTAESLEEVGVPVVLSDGERWWRWSTDLPVSSTNPYRINLVISGIDPAEDPGRALGSNYREGRYNIALSPWEHEEVPRHLQANLRDTVELWAPSSFVVDAFSRFSRVPVVRIPHPVRSAPGSGRRRTPLLDGLREGTWVFLFVFNYLAVSYGRKNPESIIAAFKQAFAPDEEAALVIKSDFRSAQRELKALRELTSGHGSIHLLDVGLSRGGLDHLMDSCHCYVSLHRSEGFGMTMAEAMALGKPVIATRYGGNLDFMTEDNSYLVDCELVRVAARLGPRRKGLLWAEPDVGHAARLMRHVYEHREEAARKGETARGEVARRLSIRGVGELMKSRLLAIDTPPARDGAVRSLREGPDQPTERDVAGPTGLG